ncbi:hypothetical protein SLS60_010427 [Paraconiothyrium brasiliense]|uniref:Uncharacterized protein n=1 Tax=Paraconiothyrium brasiliense TaxID=300254 RepID=A0ABR3QNH1_9PLEO
MWSPSARLAVSARDTIIKFPGVTLLGRKWFDCAECHHEAADHDLLQSFEMTFVCKKCKKAFRKDSREFEDA